MGEAGPQAEETVKWAGELHCQQKRLYSVQRARVAVKQWAEEAVRLASELDIEKKRLYRIQLEMESFSEKERLYDKQMRQEIDYKVRLYCKQNALFSEQEWLNTNSEQVRLKLPEKYFSRLLPVLYQFNDTQSRQHSVSTMSTWIRSQKCKSV